MIGQIMKLDNNQNRVDDLISHFWKHGYLTVSRKFGKFLPEPKPLGKYQIDAVGKYKDKYAIGINLSEEELHDPRTISKLDYLATRHTKYSNKKVILFVGVPKKMLKEARFMVSSLRKEAKGNIKLVSFEESSHKYN
jgi:hypothetical protein